MTLRTLSLSHLDLYTSPRFCLVQILACVLRLEIFICILLWVLLNTYIMHFVFKVLKSLSLGKKGEDISRQCICIIKKQVNLSSFWFHCILNERNNKCCHQLLSSLNNHIYVICKSYSRCYSFAGLYKSLVNKPSFICVMF